MVERTLLINKLETLFKILNNEFKLNLQDMKLYDKFSILIENLHHYNPWFTVESVHHAIKAWSKQLKKAPIEQWIENYPAPKNEGKIVGIIMAGNIPLVGLHDVLCVLMSGHVVHAKLSSKDHQLMQFVLNFLAEEESIAQRIKVVDNMKGIDALIATGSNNSARYFEHYFKKQQKIIRKNRTSVAVVEASTSKKALQKLGADVFTHFGLGCRNVTKLYLPEGYDLDQLFDAFFEFKEIIQHNKYANNYDYNKAVYLLNNIDLIENGFLLLKKDTGIHSPIGVLFYEFYADLEGLEKKLNGLKDQLQCVVGEVRFANTAFGQTQFPQLQDYADGVDTMDFLISL